jgi:protein involved in polysaccharide export with SLBB domain
MIKPKKFILLLTFIVIPFSFVQSQNSSDYTTINFLELNSSELELILRKASSQGYNQADLLKIAKSQGYSEDDIKKLKQKFDTSSELKRVASNASSPIENTRLRNEYNEEIKLVRQKKSNIYGYDIFKGNGFLTFQSNFNMPTPADYVLGPGDNLFIDIFGESESYFKGEINPDGSLIIENIGPVILNGLTIKKAKQKLISKLGPIYTGLLNNRTNLNLTLGIPRSIRINVIGEVNIPGTYSLSALNTAFNAIYAAGGINENATLRNIKLYRNNKLKQTIDLYQYLKSGDGSSNLRLENNDLILVGPYQNRVEVRGSVKTPGIYEIKDSETFSDLMGYFGGFKDRSYRKTIKLTRVSDDQLMIINIDENDFDDFKIKYGDVFEVSEVLNKFSNRVIVKGAINRPGEYSIDDNPTVKTIILKSGGLKSNVYDKMATIKRTNDDYSTNLISFNLSDLLNNVIDDIKLNKEDVLTIFSINDLSEEKFVEISGQINKPGVYPFSEKLGVDELILLAGGLTNNADSSRIEISRMYKSKDLNSNKISEVYYHDLGDDKFLIKPYDHVVIRKNLNSNSQKYINIEGEVAYPGKYAISFKNERISDVIKRAGGFKNLAFLRGATLFRLTEPTKSISDNNKKIQNLKNLKDNLSLSVDFLTESEKLLLKRLDERIKNLDKNQLNTSKPNSSVKTERIKEIAKRNSIDTYLSSSQYESIGIDLQEIMNSDYSKSDLLLKEGDIIVIPKKLETVKLRGELLYPNTVRHTDNKSFKYYLDGAGGFDSNAKKSDTYVVYANGDVARTKKFLFFNIYPKIEAGSEIIVPKKTPKSSLGVSQLLSFSTGLATLILAITQIN